MTGKCYLQNLLELKLDRLLEKIENEWQETLSPNEEMFFENLAYLYQCDDEKGMEYSKKYNKIVKEK